MVRDSAATLSFDVDASDITIEILRGIQAELVGMRGDMGSLRGDLERHMAATNESLAKLHDDMTLTNETLGIMNDRLAFTEAASSAAATARVRLDGRVDRVEADVDGLRKRVDQLEGPGESDTE